MGLRPRLSHVLVPLIGVALLGGAVTAAAADRSGGLRGLWPTALSAHRDVETSPKPTGTRGIVDESPSAQPKIVPTSNPGGAEPPPSAPKIMPCIAAGAAAANVYCPPCWVSPQVNGNTVCAPCPRVGAATPTLLCRPCLPTVGAAPTVVCRPCPANAAATTACWPCPFAEGATAICKPLPTLPPNSVPPSTAGSGPTGPSTIKGGTPQVP